MPQEPEYRNRDGRHRDPRGGVWPAVAFYQLYWNSTAWLACPERDDASDGIVGRNAHGDPIARNNFDSEAAHPSAQLGQHFVASVALNAIESAAVHRYDGALHVN